MPCASEPKEQEDLQIVLVLVFATANGSCLYAKIQSGNMLNHRSKLVFIRFDFLAGNHHAFIDLKWDKQLANASSFLCKSWRDQIYHLSQGSSQKNARSSRKADLQLPEAREAGVNPWD